MAVRGVACSNFNHRRSDAPVRFCPSCGEVVNDAVGAQHCSENEHDKARREFSKFCVNCGKQLVDSSRL